MHVKDQLAKKRNDALIANTMKLRQAYSRKDYTRPSPLKRKSISKNNESIDFDEEAEKKINKTIFTVPKSLQALDVSVRQLQN